MPLRPFVCESDWIERVSEPMSERMDLYDLHLAVIDYNERAIALYKQTIGVK